MTVVAMVKKAFKENRLGTFATLITLIAGCWALVAGDWVSAALLLSVSAVTLVGLRDELDPETARSVGWPEAVVLAAAIGFLGVTCAQAVTGHIPLAVITGFAGAVTLISARTRWRRQRAGRAKIST